MSKQTKQTKIVYAS